MKNPDCRDGKHDSCSGDGWDEQLDQPAPCSCACHPDPLLDACSGGETCPATYHRHGCYADTAGSCDRPEEHTIAAGTPRQRLIGDNRA